MDKDTKTSVKEPTKKTGAKPVEKVAPTKKPTASKTVKPKVADTKETTKVESKPAVKKASTNTKEVSKVSPAKKPTASKTVKPKVEDTKETAKVESKPAVKTSSTDTKDVSKITPAKKPTTSKTVKTKVDDAKEKNVSSQKVKNVVNKRKNDDSKEKFNLVQYAKNNLKVVIPAISVFLLFIIGGIFLITTTSVMTDKKLKEYYEEMYKDGVPNIDGLTDEQLKEYYENLYGKGDKDLPKDDDYTSDSKTVYSFEEIEEKEVYIEYLARNYRKAYMIRDASSKVTYRTDHQGDQISLLIDGKEQKFVNGVAVAGASACYTYTDIVQQGYEKFSGYFGAHYLARYNNTTTTSFRIRFWADGVNVFNTQYFKKDTEAQYVEIDLEGVEVFQIEVDINGSGTGDYIGMGDPKFTKEKATPYLDVFDLEFNKPSQVNDFNILEFAKAYDLDNNNISDRITYETNYIPGATGNFNVTYIIQDVVNDELVTRKDTVKMDVYDIDYSDVWTVEDFKTPYVNHLYYVRQTYSPQMKKLFDLLLDYGLNFDSSQWVRKYRSNIYTSQNARYFNLQSEGIYLKYNDVNKVLRGLWDCEPRIFVLLNLDLMGSYYAGTNSTSGLTSGAWFWAQNLTTEDYNNRIEKILTNSEFFLSHAKDDMTYAQQWKYVSDAYQRKITYTDGGEMYSSIGLLRGKCNGNSQGGVYLAQRLSIRSIYSEGMSTAGFHAWTYQQLPDNGIWYMSDKLWGSTLVYDGYHGHGVYKNRGYTFPPISKSAYSSYNYQYPSISATFKNNSYVINKGQNINLNDNLLSLGGIFADIINNHTLTYVIKDENGNIVNSNTASLSSGKYTIVYTLRYKSYVKVNGSNSSQMYDIAREYNIDLVVLDSTTDYNDSMLAGSSNAIYDSSIKGYNVSNAGYVTVTCTNYDAIAFDLEVKDNSQVNVAIYFDGVLQLTTAKISKDGKVSINLALPVNVNEVKIKVNGVSGYSSNAVIKNIKFGNM